MKTKLKEKERVYPKKMPILMKTESGSIVLTTLIKSGEMHGTCIHAPKGSCNYIGEWSDGWDISYFTVYEGSVKLEND